MWIDAPPGTKSLALIVIDRHPVAKNFVHWIVIDIKPDVSSLDEGASGHMPNGAREVKVYTGPNPPSGSHDYEFTLYALKVEALELPKKVSLDMFTQTLGPHCIAEAKLSGKFTRVKTN